MKNLSRPQTKILSWELGVLFLIFISLLFPLSLKAANSLSVVINEIAWMGTEISYNDEWIELYNNTNLPINLDGWVLKAADGTPEIKLKGEISANGFYLLERTDDNTLPSIKADLIYKGALENTGENLLLYNNFGNLIDKVDSSSGWFAGDSKTKQTMERKSGINSGSDLLNWQTSQNPGGTPKAKNSKIVEVEPPSAPSVQPPPAQTMVRLSGVIINEILPSPEGPDETKEWIEIFNQNDFEIDLSNWQIVDTVGKPTTYTFPQAIKISARGFLVLSRPTTRITLNNDGDGLNLIQPDGKIVDSINYGKAPSGQSYNRVSSGWAWSTILTPGSINIVSVQEIAESEKETGVASTEAKPPHTIDINTASTKELQKLTGVGPVLAQRIIESRPFYSLDELVKVSGIGSKTLEEIKKQGLAWVDPKLEPPKTKKESEIVKKGVTAVAEPIRQTSNFLFVFLTALIIAISSGAIILIFKRKVKSFDLSKIE